MSDMRSVGTSWFSWITDQLGAAAAGSTQLTLEWGDLDDWSAQEVKDILVPWYTVEIPTKDGWGSDLGFAANPTIDAPMPMAIRSAGSDRAFDGTNTLTPYVTTHYQRDIVWVGGFFLQYPTAVKN